MEKLRSRYIILIAILLLTSVIVSYLSYDAFNKADTATLAIEKIPLELGKWKGTDIPLDERIYDILETRAIINRNYLYNGSSVFLSVVYYPETKVGFHGPEGCLGAKGIQVSKSDQTINITPNEKKVTINLNRLIRQQGGSDELIYYFYKAGDFLGKNYIKLRLNLALNKFGRKEKSGSLIRVSTPVFGEDYKSASIMLTGFIENLYPHLCKYL